MSERKEDTEERAVAIDIVHINLKLCWQLLAQLARVL
jgi:hypothetical protein